LISKAHQTSSVSLSLYGQSAAGFIDDVDKFDFAFFKMSPREAAVVDPQQRLALEVTYEAIIDARFTPTALSENHRTGLSNSAPSMSFKT